MHLRDSLRAAPEIGGLGFASIADLAKINFTTPWVKRLLHGDPEVKSVEDRALLTELNRRCSNAIVDLGVSHLAKAQKLLMNDSYRSDWANMALEGETIAALDGIPLAYKVARISRPQCSSRRSAVSRS